MAVVSYREILPRNVQHRFGESPSGELKYAVTVDQPTPSQEIINRVGIFHGAPHPEYPFLKMLNVSLTETDPYHVELSFRYEVPKQEDLQPNPLARPDVWSFSTGGAAVPAVRYYEDDDSLEPLVNAAGDFFENITCDEAELRATISGNRQQFPLNIAASVTNAVNSGAYLGAQPFSWKCSGIGAQQAVEIVNDIEIRYWQVTVELVYRASGWPLIIPDVGFNYLEGGQRKRAWVLSEDGDKLPSSNAVPLNDDGSIGTTVRLLTRRVHPQVDFNSYFGTPPF